MHTPPENQGQIVEVSYGWHDGDLYERTYDHSDRTSVWSRAPKRVSARLATTDWEPWNGEPPVSTRQWRRCADPTAR